MSDESADSSNESDQPSTGRPALDGVWERVKNHKVLQWGAAYLGAALAVGQGQDLLAVAFDWPDVVGRTVLIVLIAGLPIALTIAWYHGHRALRQITPGELAIVSVLVLLSGLFVTVAFRSGGNPVSATPFASAGIMPASTEGGIAPRPQELATDPRDVVRNKVAILPCENLSPDPDDAYFATGLHQDIIRQLDKLRGLNAVPRQTMLRYTGTSLSIAEIAEELDAQALLDCTVRYANERIKITAEMMDATGTNRLWGNEYEPSITDLADVFAVQADIATRIAEALSVVLTTEERSLLEKPPTVSTEAYVLVLRAYDEPDLGQEELLLKQAIAADPGYAFPYALLAARWSSELINTNLAAAITRAERADLEARVREYAERALSLDPTAPFARSALTMVATLNWRWSEAYGSFAAAEATTPNDVTQYDVFLLSYLGRFDEAMAVAARAGPLYPNQPASAMWQGWALGYRGRYAEAAREFASAVETRPGVQFLLARDWLIRMEVALGNNPSAVEHLRLSERIAGEDRQPVFLPIWAYCYGRLGEAADAQRIFEEMEAKEAAGIRFGLGGWAMAHLAVGDQTRAIEQLRAAARKASEHEPDEGFFALMALRMNVTNDDVLRQPEFAEVLARIRGD